MLTTNILTILFFLIILVLSCSNFTSLRTKPLQYILGYIYFWFINLLALPFFIHDFFGYIFLLIFSILPTAYLIFYANTTSKHNNPSPPNPSFKLLFLTVLRKVKSLNPFFFICILLISYITLPIPVAEMDSLQYVVPHAQNALDYETLGTTPVLNTRANARFWGISAQLANFSALSGGSYTGAKVFTIIPLVTLFPLLLLLSRLSFPSLYKRTFKKSPLLVYFFFSTIILNPFFLSNIFTNKDDLPFLLFSLSSVLLLLFKLSNKYHLFLTSLAVITSKVFYPLILIPIGLYILYTRKIKFLLPICLAISFVFLFNFQRINYYYTNLVPNTTSLKTTFKSYAGGLLGAAHVETGSDNKYIMDKYTGKFEPFNDHSLVVNPNDISFLSHHFIRPLTNLSLTPKVNDYIYPLSGTINILSLQYILSAFIFLLFLSYLLLSKILNSKSVSLLNLKKLFPDGTISYKSLIIISIFTLLFVMLFFNLFSINTRYNHYRYIYILFIVGLLPAIYINLKHNVLIYISILGFLIYVVPCIFSSPIKEAYIYTLKNKTLPTPSQVTSFNQIFDKLFPTDPTPYLGENVLQTSFSPGFPITYFITEPYKKELLLSLEPDLYTILELIQTEKIDTVMFCGGWNLQVLTFDPVALSSDMDKMGFKPVYVASNSTIMIFRKYGPPKIKTVFE